MTFSNLRPNKDWTLFLDRDGVINQRLNDDYVKNPEEFVFLDGVLESIAFFSKHFGRILVVTNQQGVGKGLMEVSMLQEIHQKMLMNVEAAGGKIDKVYFCPDLESSKSIYRKPRIGMGLLAKKDFPKIDFQKSIMVGDTITDMLFGKRLKMNTVLISEDPTLARLHQHLIQFCFPSLAKFAEFLHQNLEQ